MQRGNLLIHNGHETDPFADALGVPLIQSSTFDQSAFYNQERESAAPEGKDYQ